MGTMTPMMVQYLKTKEDYKDCILFYRLGDFYEMFYDDALIASKELEITLTGKNCGLEERAPMCGIPFHAYEGYLNRLVFRGYKVAICEQVEDPKQAKGLVKREVIKIVTPGTNMNAQALDETRNQYLMSIIYDGTRFGIATADVSTGIFLVTHVEDLGKTWDEIQKFVPAEILCNKEAILAGLDERELRSRYNIPVSTLEDWYFGEETCVTTLSMHFHVKGPEGLGLTDHPCSIPAAGSLLRYLEETQKSSLGNITELKVYATEKYMLLDTAARRNLELTETLREKRKTGSLLWVLDKTKTAMGARLLRSFIEQPLNNMQEITARQSAVSELKKNALDREELREYLSPVYDLERLMGRITYESANPRDMIAFGNSLSMLPFLKTVLESFKSPLLKQIYEDLDTLEDLCGMIRDRICEDPPITVKEGGILRTGFSQEVDRLRNAKKDGKEWLADLEARERESTGIKNLKIKYNKVFGYYIEVTNSYMNLVPDRYIRKQTLTGGERYSIPELKELENTILGAEDRLYALEYDLFCELRRAVAGEICRVKKTACAIALLDVLASLAQVAEKNHYVCPVMNETGMIRIKEGRHPVVEKMMKDHSFVPNDTYLDNRDARISVITGPNMAGKSTYMRQTALIVLMAHLGSYVPASEAEISICDRIFTRVGASDDLASGQSTFMVEMNEVANIVRNATSKSLIVLDEIGRGTSTFDGLSIAWAVVEYIADPVKLGAKTLFATHYHELTELEGKIQGINNYCVAVKEQGDDIVFLRKIVKGGADRSYGIQVARLAGVPDSIISRAHEISNSLSESDISQDVESLLKDVDAHGRKPVPKKKKYDEVDLAQVSLFDTVTDDNILEEIKNLDISRMTPLEALSTLDRYQNRINNRWRKE